MLTPTTPHLLRRHAAAFIVSFISLTALLLARFAVRQMPHLAAGEVPVGRIVEVLLLAVPFSAALTIPMSVFVAVLWVFTRLGAQDVLAVAGWERHGVRRLVGPILGAATVVAALTLVLNAEIVPRANERLSAVLTGGTPAHGDRTMTIGELRTAARSARAEAGPRAIARAASYEVELQKKVALAAACIVLALAAAAIALRFPNGGVPLVIGASLATFSAYYMCLTAGESLADRMVISPIVGMWTANAFFLAGTALLIRWRNGWPRTTRGAPSLAIGG